MQAELEAGREAVEAGGEAGSATAWLSPKQAHALAQRKVRYICACQVYGDYVRSGDTRAADIELLLHMYPSLRVAYIERTSQPAARSQSPIGRSGSGPRATPAEAAAGVGGAAEHQPTEAEYWYAVLVRSDGDGGVLEESRLRLPGNPILGEGKPENQNAALPFTRGEKIMMIDMNQEGYF